MTFRYGYNTSDNRRQFGTIAAGSRDAAYAELKKRGIRPFCVELAPGFSNKLASLGKRGLAIILLAVALIAALITLIAVREREWQPSEIYMSLEKDAREVLKISDYDRARMELRNIFIHRYNELPPNHKERESAKALYGELSLEIDRKEADHQEVSRISD